MKNYRGRKIKFEMEILMYRNVAIKINYQEHDLGLIEKYFEQRHNTKNTLTNGEKSKAEQLKTIGFIKNAFYDATDDFTKKPYYKQ